MLELQPGMVSKICESFKGPSHGCGIFSRCPDRRPAPHADGRVGHQTEKARLSTWRYFPSKIPPAIQAELINDTLPRDRQPTNRSRAHREHNDRQTKDMATREIVGWSMTDQPGAAHGQRGNGRSGTEPVAAGSLADER